MDLAHVTPLILTWNEAPNIERCLARLGWAREVVIIDSGSSDDTAAIAARYPNVRYLVRPFDDHTTQWNFGVDVTNTRWVLSLDADYVLCQGFEAELSALEPGDDIDAFLAAFRYVIGGRPLRASLYPPRAVLFRKDRCRYEEDGHTQLLHIPGRSRQLLTRIDHDDRKPLSRWLASQDKYAILEVAKLSSLRASELRLQDRIRRTMILGPFFVLAYTLIVRRTLLDGWRGWYYTFQRVLAEIILSLRLLEKKLDMN